MPRLIPAIRLFLFCMVVLAMPRTVGAQDSGGLTPVRLQLKWTHQFQGAGFYVALEKGYYRDAGLDVSILPGGPTIDAAKQVLGGSAEFGVSSAGLLVERAKGNPVVALAVLMQHSPLVLVARGDGGPQHVHDLPGHKMMLETHADELLAYLAVERVPLASLTLVPHTGDVQSLIKGDADVITAYTTSEPYALRIAGFPYHVISPRAAGIDFYGDTIFTSQALLERAPSLVEAFRAASLRGWREAMADPGGAIDLIQRQYAPHLPRARLSFEAEEMSRLMMVDMVEVGYMHAGRWRHIADGFAAAGLMPDDFDLTGFLYEPNRHPDLTWFYATIAGLGGLTLVTGLIMTRFRRLNRQLRQEVAERTRLENHFRELADIDSLTGIANRRAFLARAHEELARARATGTPLSLLMLDIDHFKSINDRFGHAAGDQCLVGFRVACQMALRHVDIMGRLGGEEFAVLLPDTERAGVIAAAERVRAQVEATGQDAADGRSLTVSIGAATHCGGETLDQLLVRADRALYAAKLDGRNRVVMA